MTTRLRPVAAAVAAVTLIAACGGDDGDDSTDESIESETTAAPVEEEPAEPEPDEDVSADDEAFGTDDGGAELEAEDDESVADVRSGEVIVWTDCGSAECGTVEVPIDAADDGLGMIDIAVSVHRATGPDDDWLGYLFVNPGGPGGSGIEFARAAASGVFTAPVLERFDVVGFDPRGVGASEPAFSCGDGSEYLELVRTIEGDIDTDAEIGTATEIAALCGDVMGPAGNRLHSAAVASDMDAIRAALGADQISYYGGSYGSVLGVWYATLFPDAVRAMVVDGADNPIDEDTDDVETLVQNQLEEAGAFETQFGLALDACVDESCPIFNDGNPRGVVALAGEKVDLVTDASPTASPSTAVLGIVTPLYAENRWGELYDALADLAFFDDPTALVDISLEQTGSTPGATITAHVNCLDSWVLQPELAAYDAADLERDEQVRERLIEELPLFSPFLIDEFGSCPFYDEVAPALFEGDFDGAGVPIVVIGNVSDPATPFVESEELALEQLSNGFLVEVDHPSHVVYPGGMNPCVNAAVEAMLVDVTPPAEQVVTCEATGDGQTGGGMDLQEAGGVVFQACVEYAASVVPDADPTMVEAACSDAVDATIDQLGEDVVIVLASGEADERGPEVVEIFDEEFAEAGLG